MTSRYLFTPFALTVLCIAAAHSAAESPATVQKPSVVVFEQNFPWHDFLGSGEYLWGYDQYLRMADHTFSLG